MFSLFDRRVVSESVLDFVRRAQRLGPCHLGGGVALAGAYLGHRLTGDIDLFVHGDAQSHRALVEELSISTQEVAVLRDAGHLVRLRLLTGDGSTEIDVVHEPVQDISTIQPILEGIVVEDLADLRANKLTCILSRAEPRDLVDLFFLDRAGFPPELDLELALQKDAGVDPGVLAWLLGQFPLRPLPQMLLDLAEPELEAFRADLASRLRSTSV
jgi:hypothetical protein